MISFVSGQEAQQPKATYYVDYVGGNDDNAGKTADAAWKHAPGDPQAGGNAKAVTLVAGDVVQLKSGVIYRGTIAIPASGEKGKPITYRGTGWGEGRAIVDGSELVTGWRQCKSAAEAGGSEQFANIYWTEVTADSPYMLNLQETDAATGKDDFLWIAQNPNPKMPFFHDRTDSFIKVARENLTTTSITAKDVFTSNDPQHFKGASVLIWQNPNFTVRHEITAYDPAAGKISFENIGENALYPDKRAQYFAIYNSPYAIDHAGEYAISEPDAAGKRKVYLWPRSTEKLDQRITRSVLEQGIQLSKQSNLTVEGFEVRKFAGSSNQGGCGITTATRGVGTKGGYVIRDNYIHHNKSGGKGYGGIYLDDTVDAVIENNRIVWNSDHRAIFVTSGDNIIIRNNFVEYAGRTAVVMYGGKRSQILSNHISHIYGTHANAFTLYIACEDVLVANNVITDATTPITFQDSGSLYFINNVADGGEKNKNVNEWPTTKRGPWATGDIVFINNSFTNGESNNALSLGKEPKNQYILINNVIDGLNLAKEANAVRTHNIYTGLSNAQGARYGWELAEKESVVEDAGSLFADAQKMDLQLKAGGPASGTGADVEKYLPRKKFPDVDFDKLLGNPKAPNIGASIPMVQE